MQQLGSPKPPASMQAADPGAIRKKRNWRDAIWESPYLPIAYLIFVTGFFYMPSSRWHNNLYYGLVLVPYILALKPLRVGTLLDSTILRLTLLYLALLVVSLAWAVQAPDGDWLRFSKHFLYLSFFLIISVDLQTRHEWFQRYFFRALVAAAAFGAVLSIAWFYIDGPPIFKRLDGFGRLENSNLASASVGVTVLVAYFYGLHGRDAGGQWRLLYFAGLFLGVVFIVLCQSRSQLLALTAAFFMGSFLLRRYLLPLLISVVIVTALTLLWMDILPAGKFIERGVSFRPQIWGEALAHILEHPILGNGSNFKPTFMGANDKAFNHAHSVYLSSLLWVGIGGTLILLAVCALALRQGWRSFSETGDCLLITLLVHALLSIVFDSHRLMDNPRQLYLFFWIPIVLAVVHELGDRAKVYESGAIDGQGVGQ